MQRRLLYVWVVCFAVVFLSVGASAAENLLENGSFDINLPPRKNPQGYGNEYIYGWRPFAGSVWMNQPIEHVKVVERSDAPSGYALRLLGHESGYVGLRSSHIPVEPGEFYTLTAKSYVAALAEPSRFQVWVEFWPAEFSGENSANRLDEPRARATLVGQWEDLEVTVLAPSEAATATVLIIIHTIASGPRLPAEVYVTDVRFTVAE